MDLIQTIWDKSKDILTDNGVDWAITGIITYFSIKTATRQYYDHNKKAVAQKIMEQSLRAMLSLTNSEKLPDNTKVILVEYKGRSYKIKRKDNALKEPGFLRKIRRTVACVGGDVNGVSPSRPINYGVLGIANICNRAILFDFKNGLLYRYDNGEFQKLDTEEDNGFYYYKRSDGERLEIAPVNTTRDTMIAVPIGKNGKLYGGITFDMKAGDNTIYQRITNYDSEAERRQKNEVNKSVMREALETANNLFTAYFNKKDGATNDY